MEEPLPENVPPQLPEYHFQLESGPKAPPLSVSVDDEPGIIPEGDAVAKVGGDERGFTVIVPLTHWVVLHNPSALTKYVVVVEAEKIFETPLPS